MLWHEAAPDDLLPRGAARVHHQVDGGGLAESVRGVDGGDAGGDAVEGAEGAVHELRGGARVQQLADAAAVATRRGPVQRAEAVGVAHLLIGGGGGGDDEDLTPAKRATQPNVAAFSG